MECHGGYLCRLEAVSARTLVEIGKESLQMEGRQLSECSLLVSLLSDEKIVRIAFDGPFTYGKRGARWYETHHAFARILSRDARTTVHAYVIDPDEFEVVVTYGGGHKVGGEAVVYESVEAPDDEDEAAFERLKSRWPLGHLAKIFGVGRETLLRIPRASSVLLDLNGAQEPSDDLFMIKKGRAAGS